MNSEEVQSQIQAGVAKAQAGRKSLQALKDVYKRQPFMFNQSTLVLGYLLLYGYELSFKRQYTCV